MKKTLFSEANSRSFSQEIFPPYWIRRFSTVLTRAAAGSCLEPDESNSLLPNLWQL